MINHTLVPNKETMTDKKDSSSIDEAPKLDPSKIARNLRIAPSKRQILQLPKDLLLKHNALIFHKASSLSAAQRKLVQGRVAYGINKGTIKTEEVAKEINKLNALVRGELTKVVENDSSTDEQE